MTTKSVDLADPSETPETVTVEARGVKYTFRELEISEYDKLVKQASHEEPDADGIMQDVTDNTLLLRLMVFKSCVDPKLTADAVTKMGTRLYRGLSRVVNELHFNAEPIVQIKDDEPASEETPKGNE
jgi:hypothetical protein